MRQSCWLIIVLSLLMSGCASSETDSSRNSDVVQVETLRGELVDMSAYHPPVALEYVQVYTQRLFEERLNNLRGRGGTRQERADRLAAETAGLNDENDPPMAQVLFTINNLRRPEVVAWLTQPGSEDQKIEPREFRVERNGVFQSLMWERRRADLPQEFELFITVYVDGVAHRYLRSFPAWNPADPWRSQPFERLER